jgi:adenylate kinase
MILVLIGLPGSGKGTQASLISSELKFAKISVGDLLREEAKVNLEIKNLLLSGSLLPGDTVDKMVEQAISKCKNTNYVLDGYPRSMEQTNFLINNHPDDIYAIHLEIDPKKLLQRISQRYMCAKCNAVYNESKEARKGKKCNFCSSQSFTTREDDNENTFSKRISDYQNNTTDVIKYFSNRGVLHVLNAEESPEEVFQKIRQFPIFKQKES